MNQYNMSDVRKLELVYKRTKVADDVFGVINTVLGGFTDKMEKAFEVSPLRTRNQIEEDYQEVLSEFGESNRKQVNNAEKILFTTFTRESASKVNLTPKYVNRRA